MSCAPLARGRAWRRWGLTASVTRWPASCWRRKSGSLEIGEVLRHRGIASTAIYARADVEALRRLARPWPGGDGR